MRCGIISVCTLAGVAIAAPALAGGRTELVSASLAGVSGDGESSGSPLGISGSGRFVSFGSSATNLVPGGNIGGRQAFVRDRLTGQTAQVSVGFNGGAANGELWAGDVVISADGRIVVFSSRASNLVPVDTNSRPDVFAYDRRTGKTELVSVSSDGEQANSIYNYMRGQSGGGRFVLFISEADNLVPADSNGVVDVFVRDRKNRTTERVNVSSDGAQIKDEVGPYLRNVISGDGRYVVFSSAADTLVAGDTPDTWDLFVRDRWRGTTERLSTGVEFANSPSISATGRYVVFGGGELSDLFIHDRLTRTTKQLTRSVDGSPLECFCDGVEVSADGRFVVFVSAAPNLVRGDTNSAIDVFVVDTVTERIRRASVDSRGRQGNGGSGVFPSISADGRHVAFDSVASNLVRGDTNGTADVFVRALDSER